MNMNFEQVKEYLPLLIPIAAAEFGLLIYVLIHILKHDHYKHGNRVLWLIITVVFMNFIGPILYLFLGKEDD